MSEYCYKVRAYEYTPDGVRIACQKSVWHPVRWIAYQLAKSVANEWSYFDKVTIQTHSVVNIEYEGGAQQ